MPRSKVLLIGNGINNIDNPYTWGDLVEDLIAFVGAAGRIRTKDKPFPLLYEEIVAHGVRDKHLKEVEIKTYVAERIEKFQPNDIHRRIMRLGLKNILTTNYDYTLEMASGLEDQSALSNTGVVKENLYSLFRRNQARKTQVWHIHGERISPQSIALGFEHYSGYLQRMRNYVVMGTEQSYKQSFDSLEKRLRQGRVKFESWIDFFFVHDVYIVGLSLDFVEMHLWWLLTYRARRKYTKLVPIKNQITYFYPDSIESKIRGKLELLQASDVFVSPVAIKSNDWRSYYYRVLDKIAKGVG
jgi:hypothetical protein